MARLLAGDPTLVELRLAGTIDEGRARELGGALAASSSLTALHLFGGCGITADDAAHHLAEGVGRSAFLPRYAEPGIQRDRGGGAGAAGQGTGGQQHPH